MKADHNALIKSGIRRNGTVTMKSWKWIRSNNRWCHSVSWNTPQIPPMSPKPHSPLIKTKEEKGLILLFGPNFSNLTPELIPCGNYCFCYNWISLYHTNIPFFSIFAGIRTAVRERWKIWRIIKIECFDTFHNFSVSWTKWYL